MEFMENKELKTYLQAKCQFDRDGERLMSNMIDWIWSLPLDKDDTISTLMQMFKGFGLSEQEIEPFL